jgi:hypothetical protein
VSHHRRRTRPGQL